MSLTWDETRGLLATRAARQRLRLTGTVAALVLLAAGCATVPPDVAPALTVRQKLAVIIQLEHQRAIAPLDAAVVPLPTLIPGRPLPPTPSLLEFLHDPVARVRRRSAIALGRVGLPDAIAPLTVSLVDSNPAVRQMAAFALGLIGEPKPGDALVTALGDPDPLVRGRAAEALSRLGARDSASAVGQMVAELVPIAAQVAPDDMTYPQSASVEAFRLGVVALARLGAYEPFAAAVLNADNLPTVRWWPVPWALQELADPRGAAALADLIKGSGSYRIAFAARGLGLLGEPAAVELLVPLLNPSRYDSQVIVSAIRSLADLASQSALTALNQLLRTPNLDPTVLLEVVRALGRIGGDESTDLFLDLLSHPWPTFRVEALRGLAGLGAQTFFLALSGLDGDPHWSVRATVAELLGSMNPDLAAPRLEAMLDDPDRRVLPVVLGALRAPGGAEVALQYLESGDFVTRMAAARQVGLLKPAHGAAALMRAYERSQGGQAVALRRAVVEAIVGYGGDEAAEVLREALTDPDWAVRAHAAQLLDADEPDARYAHRIRPLPGPAFEYALTLADPKVSPQVYLDTDAGTIQVELSVLDAPLSTSRFAELAANGYFHGVPFHEGVPNGLVRGGDPQGNGFGGSGTTVLDEVSERPILRGTVGVTLQGDKPETGEGQFFIALTPQPDLDGLYTVIGRVVDGMAVVDGLNQWDVIRRTRVWNGISMTGRE